jgi:D-alanyl-D-alanine endopeptidase (penicillin-binding protein 7)
MSVKNLIFSFLLLTTNAFGVSLTAHTWLVADGDGRIIQSENGQELRSIASITKLMTAMVIIDAGQNPKEKLGNLTREQHIQMALVMSSNESAITLCDNYPGGKSSCIRDMNSKAVAMNMPNTKFVEASGLSPMNISTGKDLIELVLAASYYPDIIQASKTAQVKIQVKKKWFFFNNTNPIIGKRHDFIVSKTGWTNAAGGCIVMLLDTDIGRRLVVVLGSKNTRTRIPEAEFIALQNNWQPQPNTLAH